MIYIRYLSISLSLNIYIYIYIYICIYPSSRGGLARRRGPAGAAGPPAARESAETGWGGCGWPGRVTVCIGPLAGAGGLSCFLFFRRRMRTGWGAALVQMEVLICLIVKWLLYSLMVLIPMKVLM